MAESATQVIDELPQHPDGATTRALLNLSPANREKFGHEAIALIAQNAWLATGGTEDTATELGIPLLRPSKALRAVLKP